MGGDRFLIDQFRYIKIQPKTIDFNTRLLGVNPTNSVVIPMSLAVRSIVLGRILVYRNWSIISSQILALFLFRPRMLRLLRPSGRFV